MEPLPRLSSLPFHLLGIESPLPSARRFTLLEPVILERLRGPHLIDIPVP